MIERNSLVVMCVRSHVDDVGQMFHRCQGVSCGLGSSELSDCWCNGEVHEAQDTKHGTHSCIWIGTPLEGESFQNKTRQN